MGEVITDNDYFVNHDKVRRFPWSLYHRPLERELVAFLRRVSVERPNGSTLVIGCGLMQELSLAPRDMSFTAVDIDERAVQAVSSFGDPRVTARAIRPEDDPTVLGQRFDAIYAKEVIEHINPWEPYLDALRDTLNPGGQLWLSTPNYGDPWLPLLEQTVLEVIARRDGFTRQGLHPSPFTQDSLTDALEAARFEEVEVKKVSRKLALVATARRPRDP